MSYQLLETPLTLEQCKNSENNFVTGIVVVNLRDIINGNDEDFLDILERKLVGDFCVLCDIEYDVVGNGLHDDIHVKVSAFAEIYGE